MSLIDLGRQMLDAAKDGHTDQVRLLMANGAPFTADWLGINPLHVSCQYGHLETTELLLHAGISRDAKTKVERTPLHFAAQDGHIEIVDLLICSGADIEAKDMLKMTPLHWAVEREHIGIIELLLMHGADVHCLNKFDKSPIDIAVSNGRADIAEMLQTTRQNVIEVTTSEIAMEEEAAIAELVNAEESAHQEIVSPVITHSAIPLASLPVTGTTKPAPSYVRITTPMIVQPRVVKKEPIIIKRTTEKKPAAMLGRLGTTTSGLTDTVNWSDASAETLNWLEVNAVNTDNTSSIISSSLEHGQTLALTEAGKLALNFVRRHLPKAASAPSMEATRTVELKSMAHEHAIELGGEEVNTDEVATPEDELGVEMGVPAKKMRVSELLVDSGKPEDDLRRQLEEAQREALAYREQLQRKEREAEVYKKQLTQVTSKGASRS